MSKCQKTLCESNKAILRKPSTNLKIDYGFPVFVVSWDNIRYMIYASYVLNAIVIIFSLCLLYAAFKIVTNIAGFINMITTYDGSSIPACLFIVGFLCLIISSLIIYAVKKSCNRYKNEYLNKMLFIYILICLVVSIIVIALGIFTFMLNITIDNRTHDGILEGMKKYKDDCHMKKKIDTLQLTFQCCGSSGFSDWFKIRWYESPLQICMNDVEKDDAPFSCCSMHSALPCIHYDIMSVGSAYLYAPESNLSISEYGCMPVLICYTKLLNLKTAVCFFILGILLLIIACLARFVQSAHMEFYKFHKSCYWHTSWLFGRYNVNKKQKCKLPPIPPPFPCELES